jgi:DNA-binding response OmpR family regulator
MIAYRSTVVNRSERTAFCNDKDLKLKGQAFDFLVLLLDNRGRYVPAKRILKEICPGAKTLGLDAVRQAKLRLCERLEACGAVNVIDTKKGVGYAIL